MSQRNWNICQLSGIIPRLVSIIPADIKFSKAKKVRLQKLLTELEASIYNAKVKKYTCSSCTSVEELTLTTNKKAYKCDICNNWASKLYLIK